jgi:RNA polymerase sigma factor (TIGR02999 family)
VAATGTARTLMSCCTLIVGADVADEPKNELTLALEAVNRGDAKSADELLQLVYDQLRTLARSRMSREKGNAGGSPTLDATALVHEAYLRLLGNKTEAAPQKWDGRGHFFGAAALAMRRILVERARHRDRIKHGGGRERVEYEENQLLSAPAESDATDLVALDQALTRLEALDARKAKVVSLRYFAGLSVEETAAALDVSPSTVKNEWSFARAWLHRELSDEPKSP